MAGTALASPLRFCATNGCANRVSHGHCLEHRRKKDQARGTRTARGYDNRWGRYAKQYLMRHPICVPYPPDAHDGVPTPAECVDHNLSAESRPDLFWDPDNHVPRCRACNLRKAVAEEGGLGR